MAVDLDQVFCRCALSIIEIFNKHNFQCAYFITITFKAGLSTQETIAFLRAFLKKLKRELSGTSFTFLYTFELHKSNQLHVHLLINHRLNDAIIQALYAF